MATWTVVGNRQSSRFAQTVAASATVVALSLTWACTGTDGSSSADSELPCETAVHRDAEFPEWSRDANPPPGLAFVESTNGAAIGVLFVDPLIAGQRDDGRANKILWIVREPRNGSDLVIEGTTVEGNATIGDVRLAADSSPGEIYPSSIDVPEAGCWTLDLRWDSNSATVVVPYAAAD